MKPTKLIIPAAALALASSLSVATYPAMAESNAQTTDPVVHAASKRNAQPKDDLMKLSQEGYLAMRSIRAARVAIFNGEPALASQDLEKAKTSLDTAAKDAPTTIVNTRMGIDGKIVEDSTVAEKMDLIPIDGQVAMADDYVMTPEKKAHIDKANEHFTKGRGKEATEELRLAEVDATYTRVLMPLGATEKRVNQAIQLASAHKYYEANLALKAAEDGIRFDSVSLSEAPKVVKNQSQAK